MIGVGKDEVHMLSELSAIELDLRREDVQTSGFADVFEKIKNLKEKGKE